MKTNVIMEKELDGIKLIYNDNGLVNATDFLKKAQIKRGFSKSKIKDRFNGNFLGINLGKEIKKGKNACTYVSVIALVSSYMRINSETQLIVIKEIYDSEILSQEDFFKNVINSFNEDLDCVKPYLCYLMHSEVFGLYKIGRSYNPKKRLVSIRSKVKDVKLIHIFKKDIEEELHQKYKEKRITGEWFNLSGEDVIELKQDLNYNCPF